eukprot:3048335-Pleurochrysis_carterae.AAC.5
MATEAVRNSLESKRKDRRSKVVSQQGRRDRRSAGEGHRKMRRTVKAKRSDIMSELEGRREQEQARESACARGKGRAKERVRGRGRKGVREEGR